MDENTLVSDKQRASHRWVAEFDFRFKSDRKLACLEPEAVARVVRLWLRVIIPGAIALDAEDSPVQHISFVRRRDLRRFIANWGGQMIVPSNSPGASKA